MHIPSTSCLGVDLGPKIAAKSWFLQNRGRARLRSRTSSSSRRRAHLRSRTSSSSRGRARLREDELIFDRGRAHLRSRTSSSSRGRAHLRSRTSCPLGNRPTPKPKIMNYWFMKLIYHNDPNHPAKYGGLGSHSLKVSFPRINGVSLIFKCEKLKFPEYHNSLVYIFVLPTTAQFGQVKASYMAKLEANPSCLGEYNVRSCHIMTIILSIVPS